jgi:hypothetical protein
MLKSGATLGKSGEALENSSATLEGTPKPTEGDALEIHYIIVAKSDGLFGAP